jgi:hypothetical protein
VVLVGAVAEVRVDRKAVLAAVGLVALAATCLLLLPAALKVDSAVLVDRAGSVDPADLEGLVVLAET